MSLEYIEQSWGLDFQRDKFTTYNLIFKSADGRTVHSVSFPVTWKYIAAEKIAKQISSAVSKRLKKKIRSVKLDQPMQTDIERQPIISERKSITSNKIPEKKYVSEQTEEGRGLWNIVIPIYGIGNCISFLYFSYEFAREHGFLAWLFFGEFVPALKSLLWPYYIFKYLNGN